jgi:hypothetical protein
MRQRQNIELLLEVVLVSALNVVVVYLAAFVYVLNWSGILTVMVFASVLTASVSHYLLTKWLATSIKDSAVKGVVGEGVAVLVVALVASLAVLVVLTRRFNLPMALGISLMSGVLSSLMRHVFSL